MIDADCQRVVNAMCYLTDSVGDMFLGNGFFISPMLILTSAHCMLGEHGYVKVNGRVIPVVVIISGVQDFTDVLDFCILQINLRGYRHTAYAPLSVCRAIGTNRHIYIKEENKNIYYEDYESQHAGGFADRSDVASIQTFSGHSGAARYSLRAKAVHAIHQGSREGLYINDIIIALKDLVIKSKKGLANTILRLIDIVDEQYLYLEASTISVAPNAVVSERPNDVILITKIHTYIGYKHTKRSDVTDAENTANLLTYASLWRGRGTIVRHGSIRIDSQDPMEGYQNIQAQINDVNDKKTTVASILINRAFERLDGVEAQQRLLTTVKSALKCGVMEAIGQKFFTRQFDLQVRQA